MGANAKETLYARYPVSSVVLYDGTTAVHFLLGGAALLLAYQWPIGLALGLAYNGPLQGRRNHARLKPGV